MYFHQQEQLEDITGVIMMIMFNMLQCVQLIVFDSVIFEVKLLDNWNAWKYVIYYVLKTFIIMFSTYVLFHYLFFW